MIEDVNPDGTRNREYRPYIFAEETNYNTDFYNPFEAVDYGMYKYPTHPLSIPYPLAHERYVRKIQQDGPCFKGKCGNPRPWGVDAGNPPYNLPVIPGQMRWYQMYGTASSGSGSSSNGYNNRM